VKLVTYPELSGYGIKYTRKHLIDLQRDGLFPAARQISANRIAWEEDSILPFLASRPVATSAVRPSSEPMRHPGERQPVGRPRGSRIICRRLVRPEHTS